MPMKKDIRRFWRLFRATPLRTLFLVLTYRRPEPWERQWYDTRLHIPLVIEGKTVCNRYVQMRCVYLDHSGWATMPGRCAWAQVGPSR